MKRLSGPLILGLRDAQAWFILGVLVSGYIASTAMVRLEGRPRDIRGIDQTAGLVGCFFLAFGAAYAAIRIVELERDGRLDQLRLTGQPPAKLLAAIAGAAALPWVAAGASFLIAASALDALRAGWWHAALPVIVGNVAVALLALTLPVSRHVGDLRIVTVGAGAFSALFSVVSMSSDNGFRALVTWLHLDSAATALTVMAVEAVIIAACVSTLLKAIVRPRLPRGTAGSIQRQWLRLIPARFRRGFAISGVAALALTWFATMMSAFGAYYVPEADLPTLLALLPLLVGAVNISGVARADADSRILDMLRLSGQPAVLSAIRMAFELWMPFLISSAVVLLAAAIIGGGLSAGGLVSMGLAVILIAPFALLEGWHRAMLLTYVFPLALIAFQLAPPGEIMSWHRIWPFLALSWIGWAVAGSILRHGVGSGFDWRLQCAALAAMTLVGARTLTGLTTQSGLAFVMLVVSAWFDERGSRRSLMWILPAIVLTVGTAMVWRYWSNPLMPMMISLLPAAAFAAGRRMDRRLHSAIAPWSLAVRLLTGLVIIGWDSAGLGWIVEFVGGSPRDAAGWFGVIRLMTVTSVLLLAGITIAIEAAATIASRYRKPVTLPS